MVIALTCALFAAAGPTPDAKSILGQRQADRVRIEAHLERVEAELRARDVSTLSPVLQKQRAANLDRLHAYRLAGVFPHNDDFIGQRVPYFIDDDGVRCAVGHLVVESGHADVAEEIRAQENNALLEDMTHPALPGWIAASGLTAQECAMIQPSYCGCAGEFEPVCGVDGQSYANACFAETCAGVEVAYEGVCEEETTGEWPMAGSSGDASEDETLAGDEASGCRVAAESGGGGLAMLLLLGLAGMHRR
ncbi:MAG: Kazal-type serine protease inhibitor family protein [Nannocystaceae bacterium]|nr:Kazal-type serine protease inhibitor [bacterium]